MVSFSSEKDEIFRDEELRKHPFWISGDSKGCSGRGRMVDIKCEVECGGCVKGFQRRIEEKGKKKSAGIDGGTQALLKDWIGLCGSVSVSTLVRDCTNHYAQPNGA